MMIRAHDKWKKKPNRILELPNGKESSAKLCWIIFIVLRYKDFGVCLLGQLALITLPNNIGGAEREIKIPFQIYSYIWN